MKNFFKKKVSPGIVFVLLTGLLVGMFFYGRYWLREPPSAWGVDVHGNIIPEDAPQAVKDKAMDENFQKQGYNQRKAPAKKK